MKLSVLMPVYNEETTIAEIISKVQAAPVPEGVSKEIIIVNDGSKDQTTQILERFKGLADVKILNQENQGKTGALLTAIRASSGEVFLIQDADLEYDPIQYPLLLDPIIKGQAQVVYGSRFLGNIEDMKLINRWANRVSNWTIRLLYGIKMTDINTCYKAFTRRAWEGISIKGSHFALDTELTVKLLKKGVSIQEVPIRYVARSRASGKKINWATALAMYWRIIKYRFKD